MPPFRSPIVDDEEEPQAPSSTSGTSKFKSAKTGKVYDVPNVLKDDDAIDKFIELHDNAEAKPPTKESIPTKVGRIATTPVTDIIPGVKDVHPFKAASEAFYKRGELGKPLNWLERTYKGVTGADPRAESMMAGAATESIGDQVSNMTSPLGLALLGTGEAAAGLQKVSPIASKTLQGALRLASGTGGMTSAYRGVRDKDIKQIVPTVIGLMGARGRATPYQKTSELGPISKVSDITQPSTGPTVAPSPEFVPVGQEPPVSKGVTPTTDISQTPQTTLQSKAGVPTLKQQGQTKYILPQDLRGAKPSFRMGDKIYRPQFANDLDKAAYIIAQKNPSVRDADYLSFFTKATGMSEEQARQYGQKVKARIKANVVGAEPGDVAIPDMYTNYSKPPLSKTDLSNATVVQDRIQQVKPIVRPNPDGSINLKNPTKETIDNLGSKGYKPATGEVAPDGSIQMVKDITPPQSSPSPMNLRGKRNLPFQVGDSSGGGEPPNIALTKMIGPEPEPKPTLQYPKKSDITENIMQVLRAPKSMMATGNLHALLRQGLFLIDRPEYWKSLGPMIRAINSEEGDLAVRKTISELPTQRLQIDEDGEYTKPSIAKSAGLELTDFYGRSGPREEAMPPSIADKIPGLKGLNRGFHTFNNHLRATVFDNLYNGALKEGITPDAKGIAKTVNILSGRGPGSSSDIVNTFLFSPKLFSSRLQILQGPLKIAASYAKDAGAGDILPRQIAESFNNYASLDPVSRKQMARSLITVATGVSSLLALAKYNGYDVTSDPRSTDFGKIRKGNTTTDLTGGLGPFIRLISRLGSGQSLGPMPYQKTSDIYDPKFGKKSGLDLTTDFIESHGSPYAQLGMDLLRGGKDAVGKKNDFTTLNPFENRAVQMFMPLFAEDIYQVLDKDPEAKELLFPAFLGATTQTFEPPQKKNPNRIR